MRPGITVLIVVLHGCFVTGAMLGAQGLVTLLRRSRAEHHQVMLVGLAAVAAIIPAFGLAWFVVEGPGTLADSEDSGIPRFMTDEASADRKTLFLPGNLPDGMQTADRMLDVRNAAYPLSFRHRQ